MSYGSESTGPEKSAPLLSQRIYSHVLMDSRCGYIEQCSSPLWLQKSHITDAICNLWWWFRIFPLQTLSKTHVSPESICNCKITLHRACSLPTATSIVLVAGEIEREWWPIVNVLLSHCPNFSSSLPWAWLLSLKIQAWPHQNTKRFFLNPNLTQLGTAFH